MCWKEKVFHKHPPRPPAPEYRSSFSSHHTSLSKSPSSTSWRSPVPPTAPSSVPRCIAFPEAAERAARQLIHLSLVETRLFQSSCAAARCQPSSCSAAHLVVATAARAAASGAAAVRGAAFGTPLPTIMGSVASHCSCDSVGAGACRAGAGVLGFLANGSVGSSSFVTASVGADARCGACASSLTTRCVQLIKASSALSLSSF